jgi:CBS domain-containing membrane protein
MRRDFVSLAPAESLLEAHRTMQLARLRHLPIVDGAQLVGIVSYRDLQEDALARADRLAPGWLWRALREVAVGEAAVRSPWFVHPDMPADEAARRMLRLHLGCLPVCEGGSGGRRLVGLLAESDLLRAAWTQR